MSQVGVEFTATGTIPLQAPDGTAIAGRPQVMGNGAIVVLNSELGELAVFAPNPLLSNIVDGKRAVRAHFA